MIYIDILLGLFIGLVLILACLGVCLLILACLRLCITAYRQMRRAPRRRNTLLPSDTDTIIFRNPCASDFMKKSK